MGRYLYQQIQNRTLSVKHYIFAFLYFASWCLQMLEAITVRVFLFIFEGLQEMREKWISISYNVICFWLIVDCPLETIQTTHKQFVAL